MSKVVAVRKDEAGRITDYKLDDGRILSHQEAVNAAALGQIEGCTTFTNREGEESIRSKRGRDHYKLSELPEF